MLQFLHQKYDIKSSDISEKMELEKLREEIKLYRQKYNIEDKEMEIKLFTIYVIIKELHLLYLN